MEDIPIPIDDIYVPVKRRKELDEEKVASLAEEILEDGQKTPIHVRRDKDRLVLVEGLHRMEAARLLGETTVIGIVVGTPQR